VVFYCLILRNDNMSKVLVLRTCAADMSAYGGFIWPRSGFIEAPDWKPQAECGNGLHGLLWGEGSAGYLSDAEDANWMVCEVEESEIVDLEDKVKFPKCNVVFCGSKSESIAYLMENGGRGYAIVHSTLTGGDGSTLTGGDGSTLTGGYGSTLTGGNRSTLTGGDGSTLTGGDGSTLTGGYGSTLTGGDGSTLTGGDGSTLTGGYGSTLTGGNDSTLTGGNRSTLTGGENATLIVKRWNGKRYKMHIAYVGEDGIKQGVKYRLNDENEFVEVAE
jgi:hypothetical protein